ncbi:MAG: 2Fe-2S iron-sulfur cluster-binding protein [Phycisphaerales bacterium]|nr:2Fe-2S iron-sulfur cluster-binding protein [Phycisphaerales bacterium]
MADEHPMLKVVIDNITVEVPAGTTILNAARKIGGSVAPPAMCYYSKLQESGGKCRTCLVEVSKGSEKDPRPMPKLVASCRTTVMDGMEVKNITSSKVISARAGVVEMLLANHPLDCPVCDQAGECHLQDLSFAHGQEKTRYEFPRRTFPKVDLGDYIQLHMNRCILCYRCVNTANEVCGSREHGVLDRGDHAQIATFISENLKSEFIGNVIDVCPVGALTDKTFRFKNRVWFTKPVYAHRNCPTCCGEVTLWYRGDDIFRVTARKDEWDEIKDSSTGKKGWICNTCRFEKKKTADWVIEENAHVDRHSVIAQGHYEHQTIPKEALPDVLSGNDPKILMDIHTVSGVNAPGNNLGDINGPAHSTDFHENR